MGTLVGVREYLHVCYFVTLPHSDDVGFVYARVV